MVFLLYVALLANTPTTTEPKSARVVNPGLQAVLMACQHAVLALRADSLQLRACLHAQTGVASSLLCQFSAFRCILLSVVNQLSILLLFDVFVLLSDHFVDFTA